MTLRNRLRSGWWLVVLGVVGGLLGAQWVLHESTPLYRSTTQLFVAAAGSAGTAGTPGSTSTAYTGSLFTQQRVASYVGLLNGDRLSREVVDELGLPMAPGDLAGEVTGTAVPNTVLLQVTVTDPSPRRAQAIAAAYARHVITDVTALEKPDPAAPSAVKVSTVQDATFEPHAVSPDVLRDRGLGALLGLVAGVALAAVRYRTRSRVGSVEDVEAATGTPVLATVARGDRRARLPLRELLDPRTAGREELRLLRTRLWPPGDRVGPSVLVVAGSERRDGAAAVTVQLAAALARAGRRVLLVDADPGSPAVSRAAGLEGVDGLAEVLDGTADEAAVVHEPGPGVPAVLPAGRPAADSAAVFPAGRLRSLIEALGTGYDVVLVAAPPVLPEGDAAALGALGDGCLLVTRHGSARRARLAEAAGRLTWYGASLLGAVLTGVPERQAVARGYRHRYAPDPARAELVLAGTAPPAVPFVAAVPAREDDRRSATSSPARPARS